MESISCWNRKPCLRRNILEIVKCLISSAPQKSFDGKCTKPTSSHDPRNGVGTSSCIRMASKVCKMISQCPVCFTHVQFWRSQGSPLYLLQGLCSTTQECAHNVVNFTIRLVIKSLEFRQHSVCLQPSSRWAPGCFLTDRPSPGWSFGDIRDVLELGFWYLYQDLDSLSVLLKGGFEGEVGQQSTAVSRGLSREESVTANDALWWRSYNSVQDAYEVFDVCRWCCCYRSCLDFDCGELLAKLEWNQFWILLCIIS